MFILLFNWPLVWIIIHLVYVQMLLESQSSSELKSSIFTLHFNLVIQVMPRCHGSEMELFIEKKLQHKIYFEACYCCMEATVLHRPI